MENFRRAWEDIAKALQDISDDLDELSAADEITKEDTRLRMVEMQGEIRQILEKVNRLLGENSGEPEEERAS